MHGSCPCKHLPQSGDRLHDRPWLSTNHELPEDSSVCVFIFISAEGLLNQQENDTLCWRSPPDLLGMRRGEEINLLTLRLGVGKGGWSRRKHRRGISRGKRADIPGSVMLFDPCHISFLWMRKITLREVKPCIQDHTATKELDSHGSQAMPLVVAHLTSRGAGC